MSTPYYGDIFPGQKLQPVFNTTNVSTGAPATISGAALVLRKDGADVTPAGGTMVLGVDAGGVGSHEIVIDTSLDVTNLSAGSNYTVRLSAGTVAGVSVAGVWVCAFSILNRGILLNSGIVQGGSSELSVILQGSNLEAATGAYNGQRLRHQVTGESRTINTHVYAAPNHIFGVSVAFQGTSIPNAWGYHDDPAMTR